MADSDSSRISPTAHYTGYVWHRNAMSHSALATRRGWVMFHALRPILAVFEAAGSPSLDLSLLARHRVIDALLEAAIESGEVAQVVEVAAGLSPRGYRFARRYQDAGLAMYVEGDLPGMAERKRRTLRRAGLFGARHRVVDLDALSDDGELSIFSAGERFLDPSLGTAVVTEGLLGYFAPEMVVDVWARFARFLARFPRGLYLFDLNLASAARGQVGARVFKKILTTVVRGSVHLHYEGPGDAERALLAAGFQSAELRRADERVEELGLSQMTGLGRIDRARIVHIGRARTRGL